MTKGAKAYTMGFNPIILKELLLDCGLSQTTLGLLTGMSRASINLALNRGYLPTTHPKFKSVITQIISENGAAMQWLSTRQMNITDIWVPLGKAMRKACPEGRGKRVWETRNKPALTPGNPEFINAKETEVITEATKKYFKLFKNPFVDDVQKESDIYMSDEHRYIEAAMIDAAKHGGLLAVIGEVGSGKSVIRRKVIDQLKKDGSVIIIYPQMIDKNRVTATSIYDAIIMDLSEQKPKVRLEQKARQVHQLLLERSKQGFRCVLIIEEAHDLHMNTLKNLKRFYELEDGYKKLLGIILIGQIELNSIFQEEKHIEMREVIRRIQVAEIRGLNGNIKDYLALKFKRIGAKVDDIFTLEAINALASRLKSVDPQNRPISNAYPLAVNNYVARAMNVACERGEEKVTESVIMAI